MNVLNDNKHVLINALLFQVLWFVAILAEWFWVLLPLTFMLIHLAVIRKSLALSVFPLFILSVIGMSFDSLLAYIGVYQFSVEAILLPYLDLPIWLASLWLGFCLTLPVSLAWLIKKPYLFVVGCTLLGPLSYLAGRRLQALSFSDVNILFLAVEWCVFSLIVLGFLFPKLGVSKAPPIFFKKESAC